MHIYLFSFNKQKYFHRTLTTLNHSVPLAARATISKDESREFMAVFPGNFTNKYLSSRILMKYIFFRYCS